MRIATGERFANIYEFQTLMARGGVEYARVDLCLCGGITGAKKVAAMAEAHHLQVVPHNPLSPIGLAACLQLDAAIPNFVIQEYATGFEAGIFESRPEHLGSDIVDKVPRPDNGFVDIPSGPGLGMNLLPDAQKIRPPLVKPITMRPHYERVRGRSVSTKLARRGGGAARKPSPLSPGDCCSEFIRRYRTVLA